MTETESANAAQDRLSDEECWVRLGKSGLGRLATAAAGEADIFPVNYLVDEQTLLIRSAPGSKLEQLATAPRVAFEADGTTADQYWSVVVRGTATRLTDDGEIIRSGVLELASWAPGERYNYVRIVPHVVEGRHFPRPSASGASLIA